MIMKLCNICPRRCNIQRKISLSDEQGRLGCCGMPTMPVVARAAVHNWEEPCISGSRGSGTVFFSGCSLHCCYCQNYDISRENFGREITIRHLREIYNDLIKQEVHNINLVNPTHFLPAIAQSLEQTLPVPVVYNSSGYEEVQSLKQLVEKINIYLPDCKYSGADCARRYSGTEDYFPVAKAAIEEMYRQTGDFVVDDNGIMQKGVIIRHLVLPENLDNTFGVIDWVAETFLPGSVMFSLMCQYIPKGEAENFPELSKKLSGQEYEAAKEYLFASGIEDGFVQELESAEEIYIPQFNLEGV